MFAHMYPDTIINCYCKHMSDQLQVKNQLGKLVNRLNLQNNNFKRIYYKLNLSIKGSLHHNSQHILH